MKFLFKFTCIVGLNILFSSHQLHAADVKSLGANKIFALKQYITENPGSAKKWDVYQETINTCVLPLSTQLLTECGLFKLQKVIGVEQYNLVPDEKYFNKALINSSSVKIVELFHSVVFDLLLTGMVDNFNNFYSHMDENQFLGIGDLYPTIIEGSPRPVLTAQDLIDLNDRPTSFQTLQLPYGNATLMNVILILSHMKKEFGGKPAVEFDQITNSLKSAQTLAMHQMKEDGYLNMISSVVNDHWLVTDHANGIKSIMPTVLAEQASEFIQYLRLYQENIGNPYVDAALFVAANDSDKIKKLAQALRGKVGNIEQFLNEATAHIEETFNKIANEGNIHIEQNLISLFEQDSDKKKEQPESLGSYLKSFKTQIINVKNFEDQALIVMYYFDRVLPEINAAQKTVDGIPEHEVFSNLCAFIGRFAHCKTGQAASLGEMITALRQQTTDLAKSEWPDFAIEDEHDNQDALSYIKNVVNDAVQKAKEALFKQTFVQETHEESSSVLLRRNLELCSFIGLPSGSADTFYDRVGVSAWDKVNPVLQALSFYLLKLDPKDFSRVFDENLKHWLPADIEASLKNVIKEASKWQKVVELLPEIVWKQDKQLLHVRLVEVIKNRMGLLSQKSQKSILELLNAHEWKELILVSTPKELAAEMKRRKILKGKINDVKELIKEDVFILEDINNLDASLHPNSGLDC